MARTSRRLPDPSITANLTPMIDVAFLLTVFFVLVSRISDSELAPVELPSVTEGVAVRAREEPRIVLNVLPGADGSAEGYLAGGRRFAADADGAEAMARFISDGYRRNPALSVQLRADRTVRYEWVEPAMRAVTTAARLAGGDALPRLDLVVEELPSPEGAARDVR